MSNFCALPTYGLIISKRITLYSTILSHFYEDSIVLEITVTEDDCLGGKSLQELLLGTMQFGCIHLDQSCPKNREFPIYSRLSGNFPISREWKSVSRLFAIFLLSNLVEYHCILPARSQHYIRARQIYYYTATIWLDLSSESLLN